MNELDQEQLDVCVAWADEVVERLPRGRASLADQRQRAATSIALAITPAASAAASRGDACPDGPANRGIGHGHGHEMRGCFSLCTPHCAPRTAHPAPPHSAPRALLSNRQRARPQNPPPSSTSVTVSRWSIPLAITPAVSAAASRGDACPDGPANRGPRARARARAPAPARNEGTLQHVPHPRRLRRGTVRPGRWPDRPTRGPRHTRARRRRPSTGAPHGGIVRQPAACRWPHSGSLRVAGGESFTGTSWSRAQLRPRIETAEASARSRRSPVAFESGDGGRRPPGCIAGRMPP
jgi:hypothetical protein